jgi:hypothetical protein
MVTTTPMVSVAIVPMLSAAAIMIAVPMAASASDAMQYSARHSLPSYALICVAGA